MVRESAHRHQDLFESIPAIVPELPVPRIQVVRWFGTREGFSTVQQAHWSITAIGLNGQEIPKEDDVVNERDALHIADQWHALLGWPIVLLRRVTRTQSVLYVEEEKETIHE